MTNTTIETVTLTINGTEVCGDISTIANLLNMSIYTTQKVQREAKREATAKREAKREKVDAKRAKHDEILDCKRVARMTDTALARLEKAGFEAKSAKQGKWVWIYPRGKSANAGRSDEFKSVKLPKGWSHSMKRGAFYRDFSNC